MNPRARSTRQPPLIALRQCDTFEKLAGAANLVRCRLYAPACPKLLVSCAIQQIFAGVARRLTSHCLPASRDFVWSKKVPDFLRNLQPRTGKLLRWQEPRPSINRARQTRQTQKRQAATQKRSEWLTPN